MESVRHSTDLLRPPIGAGVAFVMREKHGASPLKTFKVETSSVLDRVKVFMPAMQQAQEELRDKMAEELDIEVVDDAKPHIQMELAMVPLASSSGSSGTDDDTSSDSDDGGKPQQPVVLKLPKKISAKKHCIEELEQNK